MLLFIVVIVLISLPGTGYGQWLYLGDPALYGSFSYRVIELEPGKYAASLHEWPMGLPTDKPPGKLIRLDEAGQAIYVETYTEPGWWRPAFDILTDLDRGYHHVFCAVRDTSSGLYLGILHMRTDLDLNFTSHSLHHPIPGARYGNAQFKLADNGDILIVVTFNTTNSVYFFDKVLFLRLRNTGELLNYRVHQGTSFRNNDLDLIGDSLLVTFGSANGFGEPGNGKLSTFDPDFEWTGDLVVPNANGNVYPAGQDSVFGVYHTEKCLDGGYLISSRQHVSNSSWPIVNESHVACLVKLDASGILQGIFYPPAPVLPIHWSYPASGKSLAPKGDGTYYWVYEQDGEIAIPSNVRIYHVV